MFITRLRSTYDKLSKTEKKIADYVNQANETVCQETSYSLANRLGVSQSSIIRFSKKLGYDSLQQMLIDLANTPKSPNIEDVKVDEPLSATNYKIMMQYQEVVSLTFAQNREDVIERAIRYIQSSKRIIIFGVGSSHLFAEYFSMQLMKLSIFSEAPIDAHMVYATLSFMTPEDLLIIISQSGKTIEALNAAKIAHQSKIPVISITDAQQNKLYNDSTLILKCSSINNQSRLQTMTSRCSLLCLIDMIYLNLFKTDYEHYESILEKAEVAKKMFL